MGRRYLYSASEGVLHTIRLNGLATTFGYDGNGQPIGLGTGVELLRGDVGFAYRTAGRRLWQNCSGFPPRDGWMTLRALIVHELLGHLHGYVSEGRPYEQSVAISTENIYHQAVGEPLRCLQDAG